MYQFIQNKTISSTPFNSRVRPASNISTASAVVTHTQNSSPVDVENDHVGHNNYHQSYNNYETKSYQYNTSTSTINNNNNYATYSEQKKLAEQQDNNSKRKPLDEYQSNSITNGNNNNNQYGGVVAGYTGLLLPQFLIKVTKLILITSKE